MWKSAYENNKLVFIIEVSDQCNAACPQCNRFIRKDLFYRAKNEGMEIIATDNHHEQPFVKNTQWDMERFKAAFTPEMIYHTKHFHFSGTYGEPATCKELPEMIRYLREHKPDVWVSVNTNGATRTDDWWWDLGLAIGQQGSITFDVDGIDQEMHEMYRRNTSLERVLSHMETVSNTQCKVFSFTVLFKHNQDYLDDIIQLAKDHGAVDHEWVESNRFDHGDREEYLAKDGTVKVLERAVFKEPEPTGPVLLTESYIEPKQETAQDENSVRKVRNFKGVPEVTEITCDWAERNTMLIDASGQVFPCCFFETQVKEWLSINSKEASFEKEFPIFDALANNPWDKNIFETPIKDIIYGDYFGRYLEETISKPETASHLCKKFCGKCK